MQQSMDSTVNVIKSNVMERALLYSHRTRAGYEAGGAVVFAFEHGGRLRTGLAVLLPLESGRGTRVRARGLLSSLNTNPGTTNQSYSFVIWNSPRIVIWLTIIMCLLFTRVRHIYRAFIFKDKENEWKI